MVSTFKEVHDMSASSNTHARSMRHKATSSSQGGRTYGVPELTGPLESDCWIDGELVEISGKEFSFVL